MSVDPESEILSVRRLRHRSPVGMPRPQAAGRGKATFNGRGAGLMILIGLGLGGAMLAGAGTSLAPSLFGSEPPKAKAVGAAPNADPYAEARRSRMILDGESGDRRGVTVATLLRGIVVRPGAAHAIDGGTFRYRGGRVRLADIDAPAMAGQCPHEASLGRRAAQRLNALLGAGPFQLEEAGGRDRDPQGRTLRIATRDGRSLGETMVAEGLARPWTGQPLPWCAMGVAII